MFEILEVAINDDTGNAMTKMMKEIVKSKRDPLIKNF